ncbi:MAG: hypothetical protein J6L71_05600, partial [Clostridia bacterium]|nr:hypothetical protein [Clostridia bacterium]
LGARFRIALIAACVALLSVGVYAATEIAHFYMEQDGSEIHVSAGLDSSIADNVEEPNRAWNADEGELMVKLDFAYLPDDITPDLTANGKYDGADNTRAMTFMAHDLRISDLDTVRDGYESVEEFMAGENRAYLLTSDSEIALYNKYIFILFEEEHLVIEAYVGCGITEDEIKEIASGLSVVETDDVSEALPIANEVRGGDTSDIPDVFYSPAPEIYREDLLTVGERAHYEDYFGDHRDITVLDVTIEDGISSLDRSLISSYAMDKIEKMIDEDGRFVPYNRTELDRENGKFGESKSVTKKLVVVTVELDGPDSREDAFSFLQSFTLNRLVERDDGTITGDSTPIECIIDHNLGLNCGSIEPIYREQVRDTTYRIAYFIDDDQLSDELFFHSYFAEICYSFDVNEIE